MDETIFDKQEGPGEIAKPNRKKRKRDSSDALAEKCRRENEKKFTEEEPTSWHQQAVLPLHDVMMQKRCVPLTSLEEIDEVKLATVKNASNAPDFVDLVNFPHELGKQEPETGHSRCVMCGELRPYGSYYKNNVEENYIAKQNKQVCSVCDTKVWLVTPSVSPLFSGLMLKWCKGHKNFLPLDAFGKKKNATKCSDCREHQQKKYAASKKKKGRTCAAGAEEKKATSLQKVDTARARDDPFAKQDGCDRRNEVGKAVAQSRREINPPLTPPSSNDAWAPEEDELLRSLVLGSSGACNWYTIANRLPGRSGSECRQRWGVLQKPPSKQGPSRGGEKQPPPLPPANRNAPIPRYAPSYPGPCHAPLPPPAYPAPLPHSATGRWTPEEDAVLRSAVEELGEKQWGLVADRLDGRSCRECRERWLTMARTISLWGGRHWLVHESRRLHPPSASLAPPSTMVAGPGTGLSFL
jgi:hypothetical protein